MRRRYLVHDARDYTKARVQNRPKAAAAAAASSSRKRRNASKENGAHYADPTQGVRENKKLKGICIMQQPTSMTFPQLSPSFIILVAHRQIQYDHRVAHRLLFRKTADLYITLHFSSAACTVPGCA